MGLIEETSCGIQHDMVEEPLFLFCDVHQKILEPNMEK